MAKFRHRAVALALIIALLSLSFAVVGQAQDDCNFEEETIRFGGIAPMSAPGAVVGGIAMSWAFNQAADDINAECGIEIDGKNYRLEVLLGDSEGNAERAQAVAERLILENNVDGMVGVYHSAVGLATMGIMQENGIPTVFSEPWNDNVSASGIIETVDGGPRFPVDGIDYIFRIAPSSSQVASPILEWFVALGVEDVIIIAENTDYGQPAAAGERALFEGAGMTVEQLNIELGTEDFVPILSRIQARPNPADAVRILVTGETSFNLTQQMAELGIAPTEDTICVTNQIAFQSEQFWATVPDGNYCAFTRVGAIPSLFGDLAAELNERHVAVFNDLIASFAMEAYDSTWILADAMERAGTYTDGPAIVEALESTDIDLSQGHYYFKYGSHNTEFEDGDPEWMWHHWPDPIVAIIQYFEPNQSALDAAVVWPTIYQTHDTTLFVPGM